ncbi:putative internal protein A [uncultured Mediterranean phage uvMED]|nr:putative internal protein A [uncultured Mediterranean phage uvMED]
MSFFGDIFAGKSQQAAANYNAKILERNAKIDEQRAEQLMSVHNDYSLPKFDKTVEQIQGKTTVAYLSSGATMSGTVLEALYDQELELQRDRDNLTYNAENARDQAYNDAIQKRADADLARWKGKVAKKASYYAAGASLLDLGTKVMAA